MTQGDKIVINCGDLRVSSVYHVLINKQCKAYGIKPGDLVRVTIEKLEK